MSAGHPRTQSPIDADRLLLCDEAEGDLGEETLLRRRGIAEALAALPVDALARLQYLQPQIGCFNRCAFCSQEAGTDVWEWTPGGLRDIIAGMKSLMGTIPIAGGRQHRKGTVFPYLDNDIGSYEHLDLYIELVYRELGLKVRLSSVGYSRRNGRLSGMHERIANDLADAVAGVRFSFTPYTYGWTGQKHSSRDEYVADFANYLRAYRPLVEKLGPGRQTACVELRFAPHVQLVPGGVHEEFLEGHHLIACGPHVLVSAEPRSEAPPTARIVRLESGLEHYSVPGTPYLHGYLGVDQDPDRALAMARSMLDRDGSSVPRLAEAYRFENRGGEYYAIDPTFRQDRRFRALHIYPRTGERKVAGYNDASRPLLNAIVKVKKARGMTAREPLPGASWQDVSEVLDAVRGSAEDLLACDPSAAEHRSGHSLEMIEGYSRALRLAGFPASSFFDPRFTVDTGQIVNQGRALKLFGGLATHEDDPVTPREERGYGSVSLSSTRGRVWRLCPQPVTGAVVRSAELGGKNRPLSAGAVIEELDPADLRSVDPSTGMPLARFPIAGVEVSRRRLSESSRDLSYPGVYV